MALVLSRKPKETIIIDHPDGPIVLSFNAKVKVRIDSPRAVLIRRGELEKKAG